MAKAPAFQFYVRDWLSDPQLRMCSFATKGMWIDVLCYMWEAPERGVIQGTEEELSRMLGATNGDLSKFLEEAESTKFVSVTVHNKKITLTNRRMAREAKDKKNNAERQHRYRNRQRNDSNNDGSNVEITPLSSSSSSSSTANINTPTEYSSSREDPKSNDCPQKEIIETYHRVLPECPRVVIWNEPQKKMLRARWREDPQRKSVEWWANYFQHIRGSPFLMGKKKEFIVDLEWIVRPQNFAKIMNGRYHQGAKKDDERWEFLGNIKNDDNET